MNVILLRMAYFADDHIVWREAELPNVTTLKALKVNIQKAFNLGSEGVIEYEVLGSYAAGYRGKLCDLIVSGVTRFRYVQNSANKQRVEIDIALSPRTPVARSVTRSKGKPRGPAH